jgi:hypothetical protein
MGVSARFSILGIAAQSVHVCLDPIPSRANIKAVGMVVRTRVVSPQVWWVLPRAYKSA